MYSALLHQAIAAQYGVVLVTNDAPRGKEVLERLRSEDPMLRELSITVNPFSPWGELFIVKRRAERQSNGGSSAEK